MIIYDRWGNYIFESKHPETGWDGRVNGKGIASSGIYAYQIKFTATNGLKFEKTGSITLIR
jgi:gliding motility-associated-like protein